MEGASGRYVAGSRPKQDLLAAGREKVSVGADVTKDACSVFVEFKQFKKKRSGTSSSGAYVGFSQSSGSGRGMIGGTSSTHSSKRSSPTRSSSPEKLMLSTPSPPLHLSEGYFSTPQRSQRAADFNAEKLQFEKRALEVEVSQHVSQLNTLVDRVTEEKDNLQRKYSVQLKKAQSDLQQAGKDVREYQRMIDSCLIIDAEVKRNVLETIGSADESHEVENDGWTTSMRKKSSVESERLELAERMESTRKIVSAVCKKAKLTDSLKGEVAKLKKENKLLHSQLLNNDGSENSENLKPLTVGTDEAEDLYLKLKEEMSANEKLREQCVALNEALGEKAESLKQECASSTDDSMLRDSVLQLKQLALKVENQKSENERLASELKAKSKRVSSLESFIQQMREAQSNDLHGNENMLQALSARFDEEKRFMESSYLNEISELKAQYNEVVDHYDNLVKKYETKLREDSIPSASENIRFQTLNIELDDKKAEIEDLNGTVKDLLRKLEVANKTSLGKTEEVERLKRELSSIGSAKDKIMTEFEVLDRERVDHGEASRDLQTLQSEFNTQKLIIIREFETEIERLKLNSEAKLESAQLKISSLTRDLEAVREANSGISRDVKMHHDEFEQHTKDVFELKSMNMELQMKNKQLGGENRDIVQKMDAAREEVSCLKDELKECKKEMQAATKEHGREVKSLNEEIETLRGKCSAAEEASLKSTTSLESVKGQISEKSEKLREYELQEKYTLEKLTASREMVESLQKKVSEKEDYVRQLQKEIRSIEGTNKSAELESESLRRELASVKSSVNDLSIQLSDCKNFYESKLREIQHKADGEKLEFERVLSERGMELRTLSEKYESCEKERMSLAAGLDEMRSSVQNETKNSEEFRKKSVSELEDFRKKLLESEANLCGTISERDLLVGKVKDMESTKEELENENQMLANKHAEMSLLCEKSREELEELKNRFETTNTQLNSTVSILEELDGKYQVVLALKEKALEKEKSGEAKVQELMVLVQKLKSENNACESTVNRLSEKCKEQDTYRLNADSLVQNLTADLRSLREKYDESVTESKLVEGVLRQKESQIMELESRIQTICSDRDASLEQCKSKLKDYVVKFDQSDANNQSISAQLQILKEEAQSYFESNQTLGEENKTLKEENDAFKETVARISASNASLEFERNSLKESKSQLEGEAAKLISKVEGLTKDKHELLGRNEGLSHVEQLLKEREFELKEGREKQSDFEFEVSNYRQSLSEIELELTSTKEQLQDREKKIAKLKNARKELDSLHMDATNQIVKLEEENVQIADELATRTEERDEAYSQVALLTENASGLEVKVQQIQEKNAKLDEELTQLRETFSCTESEYKKTISSLETTHKKERRESLSNISELQKNYLDEHSNLEKVKESYEQDEVIIADMKKENARLNEEICALETSLCKETETVSILKDSLATASMNCKQLEEDLVDMEHSYQEQLSEWEGIVESTKNTLEAEIKKANESAASVSSALALKENDIASLSTQLQELTASLKALQAKFEDSSKAATTFERLFNEQLERNEALSKEASLAKDTLNSVKLQSSRRSSDLETQTLRLESLESKAVEDRKAIGELKNSLGVKENELETLIAEHRIEKEQAHDLWVSEKEELKKEQRTQLDTMRFEFESELQIATEKATKLEAKNSDLMQMIDEFKSEFQSQLVQLDGQADQHKIDSAKLVAHLENKIKISEEACNQYKDQLVDSERSLESARQEIESLRKAYSEKLSALKEKYKQKVAEKIESIKVQFEAEIGRLADERDCQQEELSTFFEDLEEKNEKERCALEAVSQEFDAFKVKYSELQEEHNALLGLFSEQKSEIASLRRGSMKEDQNGSLLQITEDYKRLAETLNEGSADILKSITEQYDSKVFHMEKKIENLKAKVDEGVRKEQCLVLELEVVGKECDSMRRRLNSQEKPVVEEQINDAKMSRLSARNSSLSNQLAVVKTKAECDVEELSSSIAAKEIELQRLYKECSSLKSECNHLQELLKQEKDSCESVTEMCEERDAKIQKLLSEVKRLEDENLELLEASGRWKMRYEREHATAASMVSRCSELSKSLDDSQLEEDQRDIKELISEIESLKKYLAEEQQANGEYMRRLSKANETKKEVQQSLREIVKAMECIFPRESICQTLYPELTKGIRSSMHSFTKAEDSHQIMCLVENVDLLVKEMAVDFSAVNNCLAIMSLIVAYAHVQSQPNADVEVNDVVFNIVSSLNLRKSLHSLLHKVVEKETPLFKSSMVTGISSMSPCVQPYVYDLLCTDRVTSDASQVHSEQPRLKTHGSPGMLEIIKTKQLSEKSSSFRQSPPMSPSFWRNTETQRSTSTESLNSFAEDLGERKTTHKQMPGRKPLISDYRVDDRVLLKDGRSGTISYSGATEFAKGHWFGISLDTKSGKHDGSVKGRRYFRTKHGHGIFVRLAKLI
eukprot:Nk52_evm3s1524 gene=Nk52_evmTU3s1524